MSPPARKGDPETAPWWKGGNVGRSPVAPPAWQGGAKGPISPPIQGGGKGSPVSPPSHDGSQGNGPVSPPSQGGGGNRGGQDDGKPIFKGDPDRNPPIGRREDDPVRPHEGDGVLLKGRSGRSNYGTKSNMGPDRASPIKIMKPPADPRDGLRFKVTRGTNDGYGYRRGYNHYYSWWNDDCWFYPYYSFNPIYDGSVLSPWYYYGHCPGYLVISRIRYIDSRPWYFWGDSYRWRRVGWYDNGSYYGSLDYVIDDLIRAFENGDRQSLGRLIPRYGRINIAIDGQYAYSVDSNDFYDMMLDLTESTRTDRYQILDVRTYGREAQILAEHDYTDASGRRETMYHTYRLEQDRGGYTIRDFGSSPYRNGY